MAYVGKDPQWREAEHFAERHARTVLAHTEVRVAPEGTGGDLDLVGPDFAGRVARQRSPIDRGPVEELRAAAGARVAAFYSRSGFAKTAALWADDHAVALFAYTDTGYAAPANRTAGELIARGQAESERRVRAATEAFARHAMAAREAAERRERDAAARALRAEEEARETAGRRQLLRLRQEAVLGRSVGLLLRTQLDPETPTRLAQQLAASTVVGAVADEAPHLGPERRAQTLDLVRSMFEDAAALLALLAPAGYESTAHARSAAQSVALGLDALDRASGVGATGHVTPDVVARELHRAEAAWRVVGGELVKLAPVRLPAPALPHPRHATA